MAVRACSQQRHFCKSSLVLANVMHCLLTSTTGTESLRDSFISYDTLQQLFEYN